MKHATWVIIPAFNESKYLSIVLKKLKSQWPNFIVVDDGSSDATSSLARDFTQHVITHRTNLGKGAALKTGCEYAFNQLSADSVIFFDADDQHDPTRIHEIAKQLESYPVVLGVRAFNNKMPLLRIIFNRITSQLVLVMFGKYIPDIPSGFKGMDRDAYNKINWKSNDYLVETEIAARIAQYKIPFAVVPIPTIYHDLNRGMTLLDVLHMMVRIISWRVSK